MAGSNAESIGENGRRVMWVHRRPRAVGNFSMEATFKRLHDAWSGTLPDQHRVCDFSKGVVPRWNIWKDVRALDTDILHITGDINFACIAQNIRARKVVLTIHDVGMLDEGPWVMRLLKTWFLLLWPARSCDAIIAVSEATKQDILRRCSYPEHQIHVIPSLIPRNFKARRVEPPNEPVRILHIGTAANKNLAGHINALKGTGYHLTIIGQPNAKDMMHLHASGLTFDIRTGLTEEQMQAAYAECTALLFCSHLEGFGMPILEAQTIGVPVITSGLDPMPHVAGDGALFCDPNRPEDIRSQLKKVIDDDALRATLIQRGKANTQRFNPEQAVTTHKAVYSVL